MRYMLLVSSDLCPCLKKNRKYFMHKELLRKTGIILGYFKTAVTFAPESQKKLTY